MRSREDCIDSILGAAAGLFGKENDELDQYAMETYGLGGKANLASKQADWMYALGTDTVALQRQSALHKAWNWMTNAGAPHSIPAAFLEPTAILPDHFTQPAIEGLQNWVEKHAFENYLSKKRSYLAEVAPLFRDLKESVPSLPSHLQQYAYDYVNDYLKGGEFFNFSPPTKSGSVLETGMRNLMNSYISFNPGIIAMHLGEYLPKAMSEYGPLNTLKGFQKLIETSKGNIFQAIPELQAKGIYTLHGDNPPKLNPLQWVSNMNRNLYYMTGEAAGGEAEGLKAIQTLGYKYRPGDTPAIFRNSGSAKDLLLMRYAIGQARMLGQWAHDLSGRIIQYQDGKLTLSPPDLAKMATGAGALGTWLTLQSILTGVKSVVPKPLYAMMTPDQKQALTDFDTNHATNLFYKATGLDIGHHVQPGGITIGVGQDIFNSTVHGVGGGIKQAIQGESDQNPSEITQGVIKATANGIMFLPSPVLKMGDTNIIQIGNAQYKKLSDVVSKMVNDEIDPSDPQQVTDALKEKFFPGSVSQH